MVGTMLDIFGYDFLTKSKSPPGCSALTPVRPKRKRCHALAFVYWNRADGKDMRRDAQYATFCLIG